MTSAFTLCGRRDAYSTGLALVARLVPVGAAAVCVAGTAFGSIDLQFVWQGQGLRLVTWTFILCGRRGAYGTGLARVARLVPVGAAAFVWQAWRLVAFGSIDRHSVWQARRLVTLTVILCGRRGIPLVGVVAVRVAGVAFESIGLHSVWQAWHLVTSTLILCGRGGTYGTGTHWVGSRGRRGCLCGRRGVWKHRPPFCVAGVAHGDMCL